MLRSFAVAALCVCACHNDSDRGFDIVKVPLSAYAAPDASVRGDAGADAHVDAGHNLIVVCIDKPESKGDDDNNEGEKADDGCPSRWQDRNYDEKATERHHNSGEANACCYRRGRVAPRPSDGEE